MVKRDNNDWSVWCNHVLMELERLNGEAGKTKAQAFRAWVLVVILQAQMILGGIVLGYVVRVVVEHLGK